MTFFVFRIYIHACVLAYVYAANGELLDSFVADSDYIIREYILGVRRFSDTTNIQAVLNPLLYMLHNRNIQVLKTISINSRAFFVVRAQQTELTTLERETSFEFIEPNCQVALIRPASRPVFHAGQDQNIGHRKSKRDAANSEACVEQSIGASGGWGLVRTSYRIMPNYAAQPYCYEYVGAGVEIYVLDTGVDVSHQEFEGRASYGMVASSLNTTEADLNGHGTNVAGIAAGKTYGIAKNATIISCKILGDDGVGTVADVLEGISWVADRVGQQLLAGKPVRPIINMSLDSKGSSQSEKAALQSAMEMGITTVVAAGNYADDACAYSPAGFRDEAITVAASTSLDSLAGFSNWGTCVDLVAPGVNIVGPWSTESTFCDTFVRRAAGCYATMNGTSQAAPMVTGTIAKYLGSLSDEQVALLTPSVVQSMITSTATTDTLVMPSMTPGTPNKLVYSGCGEQIYWPTDPNIASVILANTGLIICVALNLVIDL